MISGLLLILPLLTALISLGGPRQFAAKLATVLSLGSLALSIYAYCDFLSHGASNFAFCIPWVKSPAINLQFTMDGIALMLIVMTNICIPFIHLSANKRDLNNPRIFHFLIGLMQMALIGVFIADDLLLYYIFWELTIIPAYFMLIYWGGRNRRRITFKFFLYTVFGSLLMMVAILYMYANHADGGAINTVSIFNLNIELEKQYWIFAGFMMAFAVKLPLIPFHTWQANTYNMAPAQGTMILSGLLAKMALFSIVRWMMPCTPGAVQEWGPFILMCAVGGVVYAGVVAILQKEMKKMFAYVSLAHISLMVAGIFSLSKAGIEGAFTQAFSHGFNTVALFICADIIHSRVGTTELAKLGGIRQQAPKFVTAFFIIMFATAAIPFSNSFIGEVVTLYGVFKVSAYWALLAATSLVLGAIIMLRMFRQAVLGPDKNTTAHFKDLSGGEMITIYPFVLLIFVFGIVYQPLFNLVNDPANHIIEFIQTWHHA